MKKHGLVMQSQKDANGFDLSAGKRNVARRLAYYERSGFNLIVYLDDASRCVIGYGVFEHEPLRIRHYKPLGTLTNAQMTLR